MIFRSTLEKDSPLMINLYGNHFSYIKKLDLYSNSFRCPKCSKIFNHGGILNRHVKTCEVGVKEKYFNGAFEIKKNIFEKLEQIEVEVPMADRVFPYRATFDVECLLSTEFHQKNTEKTTFSSQHELISVSICSNVPGFKKPRCFVIQADGAQKDLVQRVIVYLNEISEKSSSLLKDKFEGVIDSIPSENLKDQFMEYLEELPVLSFNGARYDLNVMRQHLIPTLIESDGIKFVIKKGLSYLTINTDKLKFLDITFYIAPGFSYDTFLRAYKANTTKSFFPYEYLDSFDKLSSL